MLIGGKFVGFALGDSDPKIVVFKSKLRGRFSYAKALDDSPVFDQLLHDVVHTIQVDYVKRGWLPVVNDLIDWRFQVAIKWVNVEPVNRTNTIPVLFTVCGTGVPWWIGPDADLARDLEYIWKAKPNGLYLWQPIGYPAAAVPMGKSITEGKRELFANLEKHRAQIERFGAVFVGYSQGAVVISEVWEQMKRDRHWAVPHILKAVTFGNPSRELGKVWPDYAPGWEPAPANTSGVAYPADRLQNTPEWWRDYAHKGDLYAACEQGLSGQNKTAIWRVIRGEKFFVGPDTLLEQVGEAAANPIPGVTGIFKSMFDALSFFGKQTAPHTSYNPWTARDYLRY